MFYHILLIDPTPVDARSLKSFLEINFHPCKVVLAGRTGIGQEELLTTGRPPFDLIIMDIDQPDGEDIIPIIKIRNLTKSPILLIGAKMDPVLFFKAIRAGANDYIVKKEANSLELFQSVFTTIKDKQLLSS